MQPKNLLTLMRVCRQLTVALELLNTIEQRELAKVMKVAKEQKEEIEHICFSATLANPFMTILRIREWIEKVANQ